MATQQDVFNNYIKLIQSGIPFQQALEQSGLYNLQQERLKKEAAAGQNAGLGQIGGAIIGKLGVQAGKDLLAGEKILGGLRGDIANVGTKLSDALGLGGGTSGIGPVASGAEYASALEGAGQAANVTPPVEGGMLAPGSTLSNALGAAGVALGAYNAYQGIEEGNPMGAGAGALGAGLGLNALGFALGPVGWAGLIAAPVAGALINKNKVSTKERNKRQTENLLNMGFSKEQMQALGRMDAQGNIMFRPDTLSKEQKDAEARKWNEISRSDDPNVNPLRQASGIWGTEGMLSTYGPDYLNKMSEFDRYVAAASAIENGGGFYQKKGEVLLKNQNAAKAAYEAAKANPELMAKYQQNYNLYKSTGKDVGIPKIETPEEKEAKERAKQIYTTYND